MPRVTLGPFSVEAPDNWSLTTVILAGPVEDNPNTAGLRSTKALRPFQQNLVATMEEVSASETPEGYVKRQIEGLRKANVPRTEGAPQEKVKLKAGGEGLITDQTVVGPGGEQVRQLQLVTIRNGVAFTLIATHDSANFEKSKERFKGMLTSIGFEF